MVYVKNINGLPLMPCSEAKARRLLKEKKAVIVNYTPFTIYLRFVVDNITQPVTLGVDAGYETIGLSATTETKVLFEAEVKNRTDVVSLMTERREARRTRRGRLRRRKARFGNRRRPDGWPVPSVEQRIRTHESAIAKVCALLPVTKIVVEVASFDIQKINNPEIEGAEYQKGKQYGYENVKAYVKERDNCTCQYCHDKSKDKRLEVHHLQRRADGDSNRPENLITLCKTCHDKYHAGKIKLTNVKPKMGFKGATFMTSSRWTLVNRLKAEYGDDKLSVTYGYITKCAREDAGFEKAHYIDARCISGNPNAKPNGRIYQIIKRRSHNRKLFKTLTAKGGVRKRNQSERIVHGFRLFDKVICNEERGYIHGKRTSGYFHVKRFDGTDISKGISYKKLTFVECSHNLDVWPA
jgi:hypothetical protein